MKDLLAAWRCISFLKRDKREGLASNWARQMRRFWNPLNLSLVSIKWDGWVNCLVRWKRLPITFFFYCLTLVACHCSVARSYAPQCQAKLLPKLVWSEISFTPNSMLLWKCNISPESSTQLPSTFAANLSSAWSLAQLHYLVSTVHIMLQLPIMCGGVATPTQHSKLDN